MNWKTHPPQISPSFYSQCSSATRRYPIFTKCATPSLLAVPSGTFWVMWLHFKSTLYFYKYLTTSILKHSTLSGTPPAKECRERQYY